MTTPAAARLLLVIAVPLVIMPMPAQAQGNAQSATYRVTFEGKWTTSVTTGGLPSGAHFSPLIGAVHNGSVTFWSSGGTASAGVEAVAELGATATFKSEINAGSNALAVIEKSLPSGGTPTATVDFTVTTAHPLVTLLSMIAPSPDWFVGVSGLSLRNAADDGWQPSLTVDLFPYDAGTEDGTEFSLNNAATSPQRTITSIKGTGKFSNQPIATLTFDLLAAPVITTTLPIFVPENETAVATLTASDDDTPIDQLTWTIPSGPDGGPDADHFTLSEAGSATFAVDTLAPTLTTTAGATVNGASLTLTFNETLGAAKVATSAFTVTGATTRSVTGVSVRGATVQLTLNVPVLHGESGIEVDYAPPTGETIVDAVGNQAASITDRSVTNNTPATTLTYSVSSPDGSLVVEVESQDGGLTYSVTRNAAALIVDSAVSIKNSVDHTVTGNSNSSHDTTWTPTWGLFSSIRDYHNRLTLDLDVDGIDFALIFQVYNDGLGFRFSAAEQTDLTGTVVNFDVEYNMKGGYLGHWPRGESSPEGPHDLESLPRDPSAPMVVNTVTDGFFALLESDLYPAENFESHVLFKRVAGKPAVTSFMDSEPIASASSFITPWRVVLVGDTPGDLLESTVPVNLASPLELLDTSWIKPGKGLFNWRTLGYQAADGFTYEVTTDTVKRLIDFVAEEGLDYVGVDDGWWTNITNGQIVSQAVDFDINTVMSYAASKNVDMVVYIDVRPNRNKVRNTTDEEIFALIDSLGAKGVKWDYRGPDVPFTRESLRSTARKEMVINFHARPVRLTGARRTIPNAISRQPGWGQQDGRKAFEPTDYLEMAMINALLGPFDMINGIYDIDEMPDRTVGANNPINSTVASENARAFTIFSGMVMLPDTPEEYRKKADMFEFLKEMPTTWDDTRVLHSSLPNYISTARRSGSAWFVCSVTNESARTLTIPLDFLSTGISYDVTYYEDDHDGENPTHYIDNRETYQVRTGTVSSTDTVDAIMVAGGGHCMWIRRQPVTLLLTPASIGENGGVSTVTATLPEAVSEEIVVTVSAAALSPAVAADFMLSSSTTLTIATGATTSTGAVTITAVDNSVDAPNKEVMVSGSLTSGGLTDPDDVTLTLTDDDNPPTVTLRLSRTSIDENGGVSTVTARLDRESSETTTVTVSATAVSPAVAGDFRLSTNKTLTITAGQTTSTGTVTITANDNDVDTVNKTVRVSGSLTSGGLTDPDDVTLSITDDDDAPQLTLEVGPSAIAEDGGVSTVTVESVNGVAFAEDQEISLSFAGTAAKGTDYTVALERLTLTAGQRSVETTVTAVDEAIDDDAETILVTARHGGGTIGAERTITITDDDDAPVIQTASPILVDENKTAVATLAATDADRPAEDLRWRITGGADRNRFRLTADGVLTFAAAEDYERPGDSDGNGDYEVTVEVSDGANPVEAVLTVRLEDVDDTAPMLSSASVNGNTLTLTYGETLDGSSRPGSGDFTVAGGNSARTVSNVGVSGRAVTLTLNPAVEHGETGIRVSYRPGTNPIQDAAGNDALGLSNEPVTNNTGDTTSPTVSRVQITSRPERNATYGAGKEIQVTVTFSENVVVTQTPQLTLNVGGGNRTADYQSGVDATLLFSYTVADGESDADGVSIEANRLTLNGGTIRDGSNNNAVLDHEEVAADSGHKVDGVKPQLAASGGEVVNGTTLTLTYDEPLDGSSTPATGDFTVSGGDQMRTVTGVRVNGSAVELTLDVGAEHEEAGIQVSYTPGDNPIQDVLGNDAERLSRLPVTNDTPDTTSPTVSSLAITSNPGSDQTYAEGDEIEVTVRFDETVEVTGTPQLSLRVGTRTRTAGYLSGTGTAALVFAYEVADGDEDTGGVSIEANRLTLNGGTIRDGSNNNAVLDHKEVAADSGHKVDGVKPQLAASGGAVVDGTTLTLTYSEPLDRSSTPEAGDFTVAGGDQTRTVTRVSVSGSTVVLTLNAGAEHLEAGIQVSYTPGTNPIRDVAGNQAEALSQVRVTNETPDTTPPEVESLAVSSNPGSDQTYAEGDEIEVTVTFNETVQVEGTPQLRLRVGTRTRTAGYDSGTGTAALVFAYEVADGDEDTGGVSIEAGRITLNRGTIEDEAENAAELDHEALATQAEHQVDGVRPAFVSAAVDGASLTLTYGEGLDGGSRPASGDFTVEVGGSGRSVSGVSISDAVVTLTLNPVVEHGDTGIRVSYTPDTNPIRDAVGNDALGLSNRSVTNTTGAPNTDPQITSPSSFEVPENQAMVRRLAARDTDPGDEVTGWEIVGGVDQSEFSITSDTGDLSFRTAPDFEAPGDNQYEVTVEVKSGAGARELEAEQTFTISVTDEREPPDVPEVPAISGETADSLTVSWSEPDNTGPAITDYDVQYREKGTGRFIDGDHEGPGRTLTLEDLEPGTVYEVRVRAANDEGTSGWSDPGEGMTVTPLTVVMASGTDPPVSGPFRVRFSFSEPVTGFSASGIETGQDPACVDDQNNTVFCDPGIGGLETADDRVFTATVTPQTDPVAHSYTLRLTVPGGAVRSSVGSKPNEETEEPLEVRVSPPGAPEAISSLGLTAGSGNGTVRLSWNRPSDNGGSAIIRYEVRNQAVGEAWSEWEKVGAGSRGVTVGNLVNGREYVFEVRAVNALGKGGAETVQATPERRIAPPPPPRGGGGGGGGGGGLLFPPEAPLGLMAMPGDGAVRLEWGPPESDGGTPILRYEYRLKEGRGAFGEWTRIEDSAPDEVNATGYTVGELGNGTVYVFELRGVNLVGEGRVSEAVEVVMRLDRAYWSNFGAEDLQGVEASLEGGPTPQSVRLRFGAGLRFEEDQLDGEGEVTETRMGGYGYRYTSRTTAELRLDYDGGKTCELRLTFRGEGAGSYSYRCGGVLGGQGSFRMSGLNRAPEITSTGPFEVVENQTRVGRLEAVDSDEGDRIMGYGIAGGADGGLFAVEAETGELMFREAPDYETPGDVESAEPQSGVGDNEYIVVVEVRSGEGERERKGSRAIRVRVRDEEEAPGAPGAPAVTPEGTDSLKVSWEEPENRGPEITDYEVRYREKGEEGYTDGGHEGTGLMVRLSGLEEGRDYEVQVRAVSEEGMSEWSQPGEGRTDREDPDPDDPSDFTGEDLEGRRLTLRLEGEEGTAGSLELRFGESNRFEQIGSVGEQAATRAEGASRSGSYTYQRTGPHMGRLSLAYDDGASCEIRLSFTESGVGAFAYDCGAGDAGEGSFRLTTGSLFVPVILSAAGRNQSFFTSELTLTNRGERDVRLDYIYRANRGAGSGTASEVIEAGRQKIKTDALGYLRGLGMPIPETGNRIGTLRVEVRLGSEVEAVVRTTTVVPEGRAGLAYLGVAEEEGFTEAVYLCGLRQNNRDRSNVAFQNMGAPEEGAITLRTTVYSGAVSDTSPQVLEDVKLESGGFHQYSGLLGRLESVEGNRQGYVKVERVEGRAPFYAYGVINDQANSDGSFIFPVTASSLEGTAGQTLPVIVETSEFRSELTVTNFSEEPRRLDFQFVAEGIEADNKTTGFSMRLEAGRQEIVADVVDELRRQEVAGLGSGSRALAGAVFATAVEGDMSGIVIGARTGSEGGGGQYSVFYNAVPEGEAFSREAWVDGLQQNQENRSNLALVNTGEVDGSPSVFHLEIYNGETGLLAETVVTKPVPARGWHQINGILSSYAPDTRQGYIRILKVSGENPFLAYGVVNDGGAPGERSGDGAYLPARE